METKLSELKGSDKLKIQAAILEILESKNFSSDREFELREVFGNPGRWATGFQNKKITWGDLSSLKQRLGEKFDVEITGKSKEIFTLRVEAPAEEFVKLGQQLKPIPQPTTMSSSTPQPARQSYGQNSQGTFNHN